MTTPKLYPEVKGTRAGYVTRYACPLCRTENIIIHRSSSDRSKTGIMSCQHCRARITVLAPEGSPARKFVN